MKTPLIIFYWSVLLTFLVSSCDDNYQPPDKAPYRLDVNLDGKLQIRFIQSNEPSQTPDLPRIENYFYVKNISDEPIANLKLLVQFYDGGSDHLFSNILVDRCYSNSKTIGIGDSDSLYIDDAYSQALKTENLRIAIIEWNDDKTALSDIYRGTYVAFKNNAIVNGGVATGFIDYLGETQLELVGSTQVAFVEGFFYSDGTLIADGYSEGRTKYSDIDCHTMMNNDTLQSTLLFPSSFAYDSVAMNLKRQ